MSIPDETMYIESAYVTLFMFEINFSIIPYCLLLINYFLQFMYYVVVVVVIILFKRLNFISLSVFITMLPYFFV